MALFEWKSQYSVKVQSIDREHQKLFGMVNELHEAMRVGKGSSMAADVLERLWDYAREHFAYEESLMLSAKYPDFAAHKAEHEKLNKEVSKMKQEFERGNTAITLTLAEFLKQWLQTHILQRDMKYTGCLLAAGMR